MGLRQVVGRTMLNGRRMIPFHLPTIGAKELRLVTQALRAGHLVGNGPVCHRVEATLQELLGAPHVLLTSSGTGALELALLTLGVGPGMEVLLPSFTFVSCATAIVRCGARPVFVEIDPASCTVDPTQVERAITPRTRAILCVHYGGWPCDMGRLMALARQQRLWVVEDAAQALGSRWRSQPLGTIGDVGCLSFHGTKTVTCGEGGAFVTRQARIAKRAVIMREKGTNRDAFVRQEVEQYRWMDTGGSFVLSDLLAALLLAQLQRLESVQRQRQRLGLRYLQALEPMAKAGRIQLPPVGDPGAVNWHTFWFLAASAGDRDRLLRQLHAAGIDARFHFVPLHSSPYARTHYGYRAEDLPVTEAVARRLIRLPLYPGLTVTAQDRIIATLQRLL